MSTIARTKYLRGDIYTTALSLPNVTVDHRVPKSLVMNDSWLYSVTGIEGRVVKIVDEDKDSVIMPKLSIYTVVYEFTSRRRAREIITDDITNSCVTFIFVIIGLMEKCTLDINRTLHMNFGPVFHQLEFIFRLEDILYNFRSLTLIWKFACAWFWGCWFKIWTKNWKIIDTRQTIL